MPIRSALFASAAILAAANLGGRADAQTAANLSAAQLLLPFTTLNSSDAGKQALADNLAQTIFVNNSASDARQQQAFSDNTQNGNGSQFTNGLGTTLDSAYQAAVAAKDPGVAAITSAIGAFTSVAGSDSNFNKFFLANGTTNGIGTPAATGPQLPPNGQFNTYDTAYGVQKTDPGQNPNGDSRPFQVRPNQIHLVPQATAAGVYTSLLSNPSFPSGHTTFGTTIAVLEAMAVPERFSTEIARGLDYGYSRVVLGVHYSLDAIAGRILGLHAVAELLSNNPTYTTGNSNPNNVNYQSTFTQFVGNLRNVLTNYSGQSIATAAQQDTGQYSAANAAQVTSDADYRATYHISATGPTNAAPIVPADAQVLLSTRFGYLTADQRIAVLGSTELPSGFPLDDGSGWARLDLYTAGHGFGAFTGQTTIHQDGTQGGFAAADTYSNDIGGTGGFTHTGTGTLTLTGNNSYSGGTEVAGGTVVAGSSTALGTGNVTVDAGGTLKVADTLTVGGDYAQAAGGVLSLAELGQADIMEVLGNATFGGELDLDLGLFGDTNGIYELVGYGGHFGQFGNVVFGNLANGVTTSLDYRANGLFLTLAGAVPEPGTWMTMLAGFGMIGWMLRGRRSRAFA